MKNLKDLEYWFEENFTVFDGPPRAYFEYDVPFSPITVDRKVRINYTQFAIGYIIPDEDSREYAEHLAVSKFIKDFDVALHNFKSRVLWFRRRPEVTLEDERGPDGWTPTGRRYIRLTCRFGIFGFDGIAPNLKKEGAPVEVLESVVDNKGFEGAPKAD